VSIGAPDPGARRPPRLRSDAQLVAGVCAGHPDAADEVARRYRVAGDAAVAFGPCPAGALVTGRPVASAEMQPADGGLSWRLVYLIVPA
jgi:hypothetical protein